MSATSSGRRRPARRRGPKLDTVLQTERTTMLPSERRNRYRDVLAGTVCVHPASVFDAMSARMAESLGFEVGMFSGSIGSATVLGAPDLVVLTLTEFAEQLRRITRGSDLPVMVDADHGYGNALNVMRTVQELEASGVAALTIEDSVLPTPFGGDDERLVPVAEMLGKLRAAVAARRDPALVVLGRTISLRTGGIAEAAKRLAAYQDTGIDGIFVTGARTREEVAALHRATRLPLLLGSTPPELADRAFLAAHGVRIALQGHHPFYAAAKAVYDTLAYLRGGGAPAGLEERVASQALLRIALRQDDYDRWQREFLR
jgi:oxaloacetate decarboxylase